MCMPVKHTRKDAMTDYRTICWPARSVRDAAAGASQAQDIKSPCVALISMGAYRLVGAGGDPVNTMDPLDAKPGIFGGLVVVATWSQLQPTRDTQIGPRQSPSTRQWRRCVPTMRETRRSRSA